MSFGKVINAGSQARRVAAAFCICSAVTTSFAGAAFAQEEAAPAKIDVSAIKSEVVVASANGSNNTAESVADPSAGQAELLKKVELAPEEKKVEEKPKLAAKAPKKPKTKTADKKPSPEMFLSDSQSGSPSLSSSPGNEQVSDLQKRLDRAQQKISSLVAELDQTRNRLLIAETEVERLSAVIDERNKTKMQTFSGFSGTPAKAKREELEAPAEAASPIDTKNSEEMPIATVIVEKAHLRTGPGLNNSPLMTVSEGTRLAVETRTGDWYRVIAPTGTRAWVASDVVAFGVGKRLSSSKPLKIKGYDSRVEDRAFELLSQGAQSTE